MNTPSDSDRPVTLDTSPLDELRAFADDGGPDLLGELIDIFLDDTPPRLKQLNEAAQASDASGVRESAHALKSACAQLGALYLSEICKQLEAMGRAGQLDGALPLAEEALFEFDHVEKALLAEKRAGA
jgi:HPt (histidine-containing phosphotransfer) domain-containing protein